MTFLTGSCLFSLRNSLTWNLSLILALLISLRSPDICLAAVITVHPASVTVPPFTTTTFTCEGTGDILNWLVQSAVLTDFVKQQREISVTTTTNNTDFSSVLTVKAILINDDLGIGCEVITFSPFDRVISSSELTIRGVSPVEDLQYNFTTNNSILLKWSRPVYYSNDISIGSPVSYHVLVIDEEDGDIIQDTITTNTNIEVPNVTECDTFNISITALLAQYTSADKSDSINGSFGYNATITTNKDNFLTPNVSIELGCPPSKCSISLIITSGSEVIDQYNFTGTDGAVYDIRTLVPSNEYNYTVRVFNLRNKLQYETYTIISTYQVIGLYINNTYTNGSVSVQCIYQLVSTDDGCHVIFTDTQESSRKVSLSLNHEPTLVTLPSSIYTVIAYDIVNGSIYGPAVYYPTLVEIMKVILSTSTSAIPAPTKSTVSNTVSPTAIVTLGTETTSSTSGTINDTSNVVPIVAGAVSGIIVLLLLIILAVCGGVTVYKRKRMKVQVLIRSDIATIRQPEAETNQYQDIHELRNEVPIATGSPVQQRLIDKKNSHHGKHTMDQMTQGPLLSLSSTATQGMNLEDSTSSTTSNDNIHDNAYTTDPNPNDTITVTVNDTNTTAPDNEATNNTAATAAINDAATVAPTYAVVGKRTDTTLPAVDEHVGDKRRHITICPPVNDISAIPPPSYADTIAQEHDATVSNSQFKVPVVHVTDDAAVVHGQYEKHPLTYTGDEYGSKTPEQDQANCTDDKVVQEWLDVSVVLHKDNSDSRTGGPIIEEPPINDYPIQFQETGKNMSFEKSLPVDGSFEEANIVHDHGFDNISDEMVGVKPHQVVLSSIKEKGTLVAGVALKAEVITTSHQVNTTTNEYQTQKVFENNLDCENHKVPEVILSTHNEVNFQF